MRVICSEIIPDLDLRIVLIYRVYNPTPETQVIDSDTLFWGRPLKLGNVELLEELSLSDRRVYALTALELYKAWGKSADNNQVILTTPRILY